MAPGMNAHVNTYIPIQRVPSIALHKKAMDGTRCTYIKSVR